jgi:hypothetical protein
MRPASRSHLASLFTVSLLIGGSAAAADVVRCESRHGFEKYCAADTRDGLVLARSTGDGPCELGHTWGYDKGGLWVADGCSADFVLGAPASDYGLGWERRDGNRLTCASLGDRFRSCDSALRGGVSLVHQLGHAACIQGQTWGVDARGLWVDGGCAGEFRIATTVAGGGLRIAPSGAPATGALAVGDSLAGGAVPTLICESRDSRRRYCPAEVGDATVRLDSTLSRVPCVEGKSWGHDANGIWVDQGCRASFSIR